MRDQRPVDLRREALEQLPNRCVVIFGRGSSTGRGRAGALAVSGLVDVLAEQIEVEHLARDRRCGARAEPGVLDQHGERDPGIVGRREGDEERVVAHGALRPSPRSISRPS